MNLFHYNRTESFPIELVRFVNGNCRSEFWRLNFFFSPTDAKMEQIRWKVCSVQAPELCRNLFMQPTNFYLYKRGAGRILIDSASTKSRLFNISREIRRKKKSKNWVFFYSLPRLSSFNRIAKADRLANQNSFCSGVKVWIYIKLIKFSNWIF